MPLAKVSVSHFDGTTSEVDVTKLQWRPSAYGIIIRDNTILLLKQTNGYDLPGGGIELGETIETAVIREVKEESGLDVTSPKLVGATTSFYKPFQTTDRYIQALMFYYSCDLLGGTITNEGFDEAEKVYALGAEWLPLDELDAIIVGSSVDFRPYVRQLLI